MSKYNRVNFVNGVTKINATNMNNLDLGIENANNPKKDATVTYSKKEFTTPENARGFVNALSAKGLTMFQHVPNGDFEDGTTDWVGVGGSTILSVTDEVMTVSGATASGNGAYSAVIPAKDGEKWFFYAKVNADHDVRLHYTRNNLASLSTIKAHSGSGKYEELYNSATISSLIGSPRVAIAYRSGTAANFLISGNVQAINMSALGITGFSDSKMARLCSQGFFYKRKSVENLRIKSRSKNLIPFTSTKIWTGTDSLSATSPLGAQIRKKHDIAVGLAWDGNVQGANAKLGVLDNSNGTAETIEANSGYGVAFMIKTEKDAIYEVAWDTLTGTNPFITGSRLNIDGYVIDSDPNVTNGQQFTADGETEILMITVRGIPEAKVEGLRAFNVGELTTYEKETESETIVPGEANSLPNGKTDFIDIKASLKITDIESRPLETSDISSYNTSLVNIDYVGITKPSDYIFAGQGVQNDGTVIADFGISGNYSSLDNADNIGRIVGIGATAWAYCVEKGTYTDVTDARDDLVGQQLLYQRDKYTSEHISVIGDYNGQEKGITYLLSDSFFADITVEFGNNAASQGDQNSKSIAEQQKRLGPIQGYPTATVSGSIITMPEFGILGRILFRLSEEVTGSPVQIIYQEETYDLKEILPDNTEAEVTYISAGLREVYWDGVNFILAPKGGSQIEVDNQTTLADGVTLNSSGTQEKTVFTFPGNCKSGQFTDRLNWQPIGSVPESELEVAAGTTAEWRLYDSSGSLIGTIESKTGAGNNVYLDNMFMAQDGNSIRCVYSIAEQQFGNIRGQYSKVFTGQLGGATLRCYATTTGNTVRSRFDCRVWTYR